MSAMFGSMGTTPNVSGFKKSGYRPVNVPTDPRIQELWQLLMGGSSQGMKGGLDYLSKLAQGGDEEMWNQLEAPAFRQFEQQTSQLANRFSGEGTGARRGSGFQNAMGGMSSDLAQNLRSQRMGMQNDAISQLLGLGQNLLNTPLSQTYLQPKKKSFFEELMGGLSGGMGTAGGMGFLKLLGLL